jgi:hypothetical protein
MNDKIYKLKKEIISKKEQINNIYFSKLIPAKNELLKLMDIAAKEICPFTIGDRIFFENEKEGVIQNISYFSIDFFMSNLGTSPANKLNFNEADTFDYSQAVKIEYNLEKFSFTWQIEGVMINKDGKPGRRIFLPKNPFHNKFEGNKVFEKTLLNTGINDLIFEID